MTIGFTGSPLLRLDHERSDDAAFARHLADPQARLLRLDGLDPVTSEAGGLAWGPLDERDPGAALALLGLLDGRPAFVALTPDPRGKPPFALLGLLAALPGPDAAVWGMARSLVHWHATTRFCARCGASTEVTRAGWGRRCTACTTVVFPRTDPVVIMLAEHGGRALIGRQPRYPAGRYSALAGFVEPGESVEEAVARELFEEAGVRATRVRYLASQPWPLPSAQLMLACIAEVESDALTIDHDELDDAIWVDRAQVRAALAGDHDAPFIPPPPYAIAHELLSRWSRGA
ncbi:MAG TPA: NAD(+) diphosphatase [Nannocystis sp.]